MRVGSGESKFQREMLAEKYLSGKLQYNTNRNDNAIEGMIRFSDVNND